MNVNDFQTNVNYARRDNTSGFISWEEILAYLNEGLRKVQAENEWEWSKTSTSFTYTDGSNQYALSAIATDNKMPISLFYDYNHNFEQVSPETFRQISASAFDIFATDNTYLYVKTSFGSGTLNYHYYSDYTAKTSGGSWIEKLSASTDVPLLPSRHQDMVSLYANAKCFWKEGLNDDYQIAYANFVNALNKMKREYPSRRSKTLKRWKSINELNGATYDRKENFLNQ